MREGVTEGGVEKVIDSVRVEELEDDADAVRVEWEIKEIEKRNMEEMHNEVENGGDDDSEKFVGIRVLQWQDCEKRR